MSPSSFLLSVLKWTTELPMNGSWERIVYREPASPGTQPEMFARVMVELLYQTKC